MDEGGEGSTHAAEDRAAGRLTPHHPHVDVDVLQGLLGAGARPCRRALTGGAGVALPALTDHHGHVRLADVGRLPAGGIAAVLDLGGDPVALARRAHDAFPRVAYAGPLLIASDRPAGRAPDTVRIVTSSSRGMGVPGGAAAIVDELAGFGAAVVTVALDTASGPVLDDDLLRAILAAARAHGLPVVAHAEGADAVARALAAGADALARVPSAEELPGELVARAAASGQRWISGIAVRDGADRERAIRNLGAFVRAGGRVLYGTGAPPAGVDVAELTVLHDAGLRGPRLITALTDPWPLRRQGAVATFVAGPPPAGDAVPAWLGGACVVPADELTDDDV